MPEHFSQVRRSVARHEKPLHSILIVEDEPDVQALFQQILNDEGYYVTIARNARQALAAIQDADFNLVITDLSLPDANGIDLIRQIRAVAPFTGVLAVSGFMAGMSRRALLAAGASNTLGKPTSPGVLVDCVRALLTAAESADATNSHSAERPRCLTGSLS